MKRKATYNRVEAAELTKLSHQLTSLHIDCTGEGVSCCIDNLVNALNDLQTQFTNAYEAAIAGSQRVTIPMCRERDRMHALDCLMQLAVNQCKAVGETLSIAQHIMLSRRNALEDGDE